MKISIVVLLFAASSMSEIDFSKLVYDYTGIPDVEQFKARDQAALNYRYYPSSSDNLMIVLHGSGYHSRYLYKFAKTISGHQMAKIITPDLRGHNPNSAKKGDVDYIGQLDDDLDDLISFSMKTYHPKKIFIVGHSSGGGLALRLMGNNQRRQADNYILLAPYLSNDAPTTNASSGWAKASVLTIIAAHILNGFGLHWLDHAITVEFNLPSRYRDGSETLRYTHALITSYTSIDYEKDLRNTSRKALIAVGENDEAMHAAKYEDLRKLNPNLDVSILPSTNHMGIVTDDKAINFIEDWLKALAI